VRSIYWPPPPRAHASRHRPRSWPRRRRVVAQLCGFSAARAARARRVGVGRVQSAERRPVKRRRPHLLEHEVGVATDASPAVRSAPASLRRVHAPLFVRWHGVGVGVDSAPAPARSGVGQSVGPGLGFRVGVGAGAGDVGQGEGVGFRCRSRPDQGLVQKSQCVEWGSLQPLKRNARATRLPGPPTGPRRPRLRQQACLVALVRAIADVQAKDAWALVGARGCPARPPRWLAT
jgi:hypothetical protein